MSRCIYVYPFVARNHGGIPFSGVCPVKNPVPAREKIARYTREISFARCNDEAGAIILHGSAAGNTSRTGRSTLQQHKVQSQSFFAKLRILELSTEKLRTVSHSTPRPGWSTSRSESVQPRAASRGPILEWPAQE